MTTEERIIHEYDGLYSAILGLIGQCSALCAANTRCALLLAAHRCEAERDAVAGVLGLKRKRESECKPTT